MFNWIKSLFAQTPVPPKKEWATDDNSEELAATAEELKARFGSLVRPAVHLRATTTPGFSRLGGLPQLPANAEWPEWNGKPQAFLAQIDLAEIQAALPSFLPSSGHLYFFYDQDQSVWGSDPEDAGGWRVLYTPENASRCAERAAPLGLDEGFIYQPKHVSAHRIDVLPDTQSVPREDLDDDRDGDIYRELQAEPFCGMQRHQMFGYASPVQDDQMEEECQFASNGIVDSSNGYPDPRIAAIKAGTKDWKLLLQLETDDDTGWMWGDVGTLYFWIREQDAAQGDFSKVWMVFQCC